MDEKKIQNILIEILYSAVNEIQKNPDVAKKVTSDNLSSIYSLAKKHDLAHIVSKFIYQNQIDVGDDIKSLLQKEELMSVYRHEQMKYAYEEICSVFEEQNISYIPLKGAVIRQYYPYESMRMSCDIDILIHEEDLDTAINSLKIRGYSCGKRSFHDVSLYSPNRIHLELHFNINENMDNLDAVLADAWKYAVSTSSSRYEFSKEFFAFHVFAHMSYHFVVGGCGVRSLLDVWIMEHKMGVSYLCAKELLHKAGIYRFASEMTKLAEVCFTHNKRDAFSDSVLQYIIQGGVYGSKQNHIAVDKSKTNSSVIYAFKRLFMPYKSMVVLYPVLKKAPYLLPFCWIKRWIKAIFAGKCKRIVSEMSFANNISDERIKELTAIYSRLGL